jgi:hypothetical protein
MKRLVFAAALAACAAPALAGDVAVSIRVGEPGFYGQIDIGNVPRPRLVYPRPVVIAPVPEYRDAEPIYLHVPPGHERHWKKHCREYNACGRPVYFVHDDWYNNEYVPRYRRGDRDGDRERGRDDDERRDHDKHHGKRHDRDEDRRERD